VELPATVLKSPHALPHRTVRPRLEEGVPVRMGHVPLVLARVLSRDRVIARRELARRWRWRRRGPLVPMLGLALVLKVLVPRHRLSSKGKSRAEEGYEVMLYNNHFFTAFTTTDTKVHLSTKQLQHSSRWAAGCRRRGSREGEGR